MSGAIFTDTQWKQIQDAAIALGQLGSDVHAENLIAICAATITYAQDETPQAEQDHITEVGKLVGAPNSPEIEGISRSEP